MKTAWVLAQSAISKGYYTCRKIRQSGVPVFTKNINKSPNFLTRRDAENYRKEMIVFINSFLTEALKSMDIVKEASNKQYTNWKDFENNLLPHKVMSHIYWADHRNNIIEQGWYESKWDKRCEELKKTLLVEFALNVSRDIKRLTNEIAFFEHKLFAREIRVS